MFLHVSVIHSVHRGGVPGQVPPSGTRYTPPVTRYTPRDQVHPPGPGTPLDQVHPSGPGTPQDQVHPSPRTMYTPPQTRYPPGPGRYGQPPGGTHPTGMQSCLGWMALVQNSSEHKKAGIVWTALIFGTDPGFIHTERRTIWKQCLFQGSFTLWVIEL